MNVHCIGMTTVDTVMLTDSLTTKHDSVCRVNNRSVSLGGKGMLTAKALTALGSESLLFTLIGKSSTCRREFSSLTPPGFDPELSLPLLERNNRTWIAVSPSQRVLTFVDAAPPLRYLASRATAALPGFISRANILYLSTEQVVVLRKACEIIEGIDTPVVSNLNTPLIQDPADAEGQTLRSIARVSSVIIMNKAEAQRVLDKLGLPDWYCLGKGRVREIIVTNGRKGGIFSTYPFQTWTQFEAVRVRPKCVVGAGDVFNAAFIKARLIERASLAKSCGFAAHTAAKWVESDSISTEFT
jgi:sugar/nucleoside kinase (ribokinase family)